MEFQFFLQLLGNQIIVIIFIPYYPIRKILTNFILT